MCREIKKWQSDTLRKIFAYPPPPSLEQLDTPYVGEALNRLKNEYYKTMDRKEAIEVVKKNWPDSSFTALREALETLVPELKESEGERIRKWCINLIKTTCDYDSPTSRKEVDAAIAWLEKKCEQKTAHEPKFKMGDWVIVHNKDAYQVIEVNEHNYRLKHFLGGEMPFPFTQESSLRMWTIQDVNDGDVLAAEPIDNYQFPFIAICKNCGLDFFNSYCFIGFDGKFYGADEGHALDNIHPATKEQRDLLFSKIKEEGYEWDADKKELKKIKQKPAEWSEEDERLRTSCIKHIEEELEEIRNDKYGHSEIISDLKESCRERINWLKSIKQRVQPPIWKPTDEQMADLWNMVCECRPADQQLLQDIYYGLKTLKEE